MYQNVLVGVLHSQVQKMCLSNFSFIICNNKIPFEWSFNRITVRGSRQRCWRFWYFCTFFSNVYNLLEPEGASSFEILKKSSILHRYWCNGLKYPLVNLISLIRTCYVFSVELLSSRSSVQKGLNQLLVWASMSTMWMEFLLIRSSPPLLREPCTKILSAIMKPGHVI